MWVKLCNALKVKQFRLGLSGGALAYVHETLGSVFLSTGGKIGEAFYSDTFVKLSMDRDYICILSAMFLQCVLHGIFYIVFYKISTEKCIIML